MRTARVTTTINGNPFTMTGYLSNDGKVLHNKKKRTLILAIAETDTVEILPVKPRVRRTEQQAFMPGGIGAFLKASGQI